MTEPLFILANKCVCRSLKCHTKEGYFGRCILESRTEGLFCCKKDRDGRREKKEKGEREQIRRSKPKEKEHRDRRMNKKKFFKILRG